MTLSWTTRAILLTGQLGRKVTGSDNRQSMAVDELLVGSFKVVQAGELFTRTEVEGRGRGIERNQNFF
jgi:hypothetical protein